MLNTLKTDFAMDALTELTPESMHPVPPYTGLQAIGITHGRLIETLCQRAIDQGLLLEIEAPVFQAALERRLKATSTTTEVLEIAPIELIVATTPG